MSSLAPVVFFVYNRLDHTAKTIEALKKNTLANESDLIIYSDGAKNDSSKQHVDQVREFIDTIYGFKSIKIIKRENNLGLANSVIRGVSEVIKEYKKVIVLEDDLITSQDFLSYMNEGLNFYENNNKIFSITGVNFPITIPTSYNSDVLIFQRCSSWGWGTWINRWNKVDWEIKDFNQFISNKNEVKSFNKGGDDLSDILTSFMKGKSDVWAVRWGYAHFRNRSYCLYPVRSKVENIGMDSSGMNCNENTKKLHSPALDGEVVFTNNIELNNDIVKSYQELYEYDYLKLIKQFIKRIFGYYKV